MDMRFQTTATLDATNPDRLIDSYTYLTLLVMI